MTLRLAFDLDGVLADLSRVLHRRALAMQRARRSRVRPPLLAWRSSSRPAVRSRGEAPEPVVRASSDAWWQVTQTDRDRVWRSLVQRRGFWERLPETEPGMVSRLRRLSLEHAWDVVFITDRPTVAGESAELQTTRWLQARGFPDARVFISHGARGEMARLLRRDIVVDDSGENCLDVLSESSARALLLWPAERGAPPAHLCRAGIGMVRSVNECLDQLASNANVYARAAGETVT